MTKRPELRNYQEKARDAITSAVLGLLGRDNTNDRLIVYQSPTGSGKTVTMAYALAAAHAHPNRREFIVLWLSPGKGGLHRQSARALDFFLQGTTMRTRVLDSREDIEADPNPVSGKAFIAFGEKDSGSWELFDAAGRMLSRGFFRDVDEFALDVSTYAPGVYWIRLQREHASVQNLRMVISR